MNKYYVGLSELVHDDENCTSWTELKVVIVMYSDDDGTCYETAKLMYPRFEIDWPTTEEPSR